MVLMNAPRKVTNATSTANQTSIFGSMPGLAPSVRQSNNQFTWRAIQTNSTTTMKCLYGPNGQQWSPSEQYQCLEANNLIFKNKMAGGVGRAQILKQRSQLGISYVA